MRLSQFPTYIRNPGSCPTCSCMFGFLVSDGDDPQANIPSATENAFKQGTGVEPASSAWEADILPMY